MKDHNLQKTSEKGLEAITALYKQMETAQSLMLKNLLATEINAYITLSNAFVEYVKVQIEYSELLDDEFAEFGELLINRSEQFHEFAEQRREQKKQGLKMSEDQSKSLETCQKLEIMLYKSIIDSIKRSKEIYNRMFDVQQIQYDIFENFSEWYLFVIGRDDRDWSKMFGDLGKATAEHAVGTIPVVSEAASIISAAMDLIDIVDKYDHAVPDYSEADVQLAAIEKHIQAIEELTQHLKQYTERLKAGLEAGLEPHEECGDTLEAPTPPETKASE